VRKLIIMPAALAFSAALAAPAQAQAADRQPPTITITRPAANASYALNQSVTASYSCTDNRVVVSCVGTVASGTAIDTRTSGTQTFTVAARDRVGNTTTKSVSYTVSSSNSDTIAPTITITRPAANATYALNQSVTASYSCADTGGSGVRSCTGTVANGVAVDTKTAGAHAFSVTATDNANNTKTTTVNYTVAADTTAPSITITTPAASATYTVGQDVKAAYSCADTGGSGVATCTGTVANGSALNTSTQGTFTFSVNATDNAGNPATRSVSYTVAAADSCAGGYYGLTFDDGPNPTYTPQVVNALMAAGVHATFMLIGENVAAYPQLAKAEVDAGNWVGNHTYTHPDLTTLTSAQITSELTKTQAAILAATGVTPTFVRPPYGSFDDSTLAVFSSLGLDNAFWTNDTNDWDGKSVSQIVTAATAVKPGGIILMHDAYPNTVTALPQIISTLRSRGMCPGKLAHTATSVEAIPAWEGVLFNMIAVKP
jgi:peptidoglycan/xylan/chitin deacetylase (PgdA/CDA1 family)